MKNYQLRSSLQNVGSGVSRVIERWMPNPFLFALILTYVVFLGGLGFQGRSAVEMLQFWYGGFWSLLRFGMQAVLILATGAVLAYHPSVQRGIGWLAHKPRTGRQAVVLVGLISMLVAWIHWGLGLIVGAVFAREMGRMAHKRELDVHYPLLCVAGYLGLGLTWHLGLSGSAQLIMNTPHNIFIGLGVVQGVVSPTQTIFHPYTLLLAIVSIGYSLLILFQLSPPATESKGISEFVPKQELVMNTVESDGGLSPERTSSRIPAERINQNQVLGGLIALGGLIMAGYTFATNGLSALTFNVINFGLLFLGLGLFTSPKAYQEEFYESVTSTAGIILQFPFYAGIMGMMNQSGLSTRLAELILSSSTETTFPVFVWITSTVVNLFVPSGGAEWTFIGAPILEQAQNLGVPPGKAITAFGVGDAYGNLFHPFWAIPLIGITGLRAREFFGYSIVVMIMLIPLLVMLLIFLPY